jgi:hypothetical protein
MLVLRFFTKKPFLSTGYKNNCKMGEESPKSFVIPLFFQIFARSKKQHLS